MKTHNWLLLCGVLLLTIVPLAFIKPKGEGTEIFVGSDDQAEHAIAASRPDYKPWCAPLWEPPSSEIESLLFGLQAALGAGALGYCLGFYRGRGKKTHD